MTRVGRLMGGLLMVCIGCVVAYRIVTLRLADQWAKSDHERALQWRADHPVALLARAKTQLKLGENTDAAATARRLLSAEPLEGQAWQILAAAEASTGRSRQAERFYRIGVQRAPDDSAARLALLQIDLQAQRGSAVLEHLDILLRIASPKSDPLFGLMLELAAVDAFADEVVEGMKLDPPWRGSLVQRLQGDPTTRGAQALLAAMSREGVINPDERAAWIAGLMQRGRWGEAYARWAPGQAAQGRSLASVFNGGFEWAPQPGFDWRFVPPPGVDVSIAPAPGRTGKAMRLAFNGRRVAAVGLEQTLLLGPGRYRLAFDSRVVRLESDRGIEWVVGCAGQDVSLAEGPPIQERSDWSEASFEFTVPAEGCPAQWLRLRNKANAPPLQRLAGEVWVDDIRIVPSPSQVADVVGAE